MHTFENISVNTDFMMSSGKLVSVTDSVKNAAFMERVKDVSAVKGSGYDADVLKNILKADTVISVSKVIKSIEVNQDGLLVITLKNGETITYEPAENERVIVEGSDGQQYYVHNGTVQTAGETLATVASANAGVVANTDSLIQSLPVVYFKPSPDAQHGFDSLRYTAMQSQYSIANIKGVPYVMPFKAVATGSVDYVEARLPANTALTGLQFRVNNTPTTFMPAATRYNLKVNVPPLLRGNDQALQVVYTFKDTSGKDHEEILGQLKLATYDKQLIKLYVIPVSANNAKTYNQLLINQHINRIYAQAVTQWDIQWQTTYVTDAWNINNDDTFDDTDKDNRMDYTPAMKALIRAYKNSRDIEKQAVYVFLMDMSHKTTSLEGYMPFNKQFAFVFTGNMDTETTGHSISHEIAHGTFNLRHTFSPNNTYVLSENTTDNLMDYSGAGKDRLDKYQWDLIHDPERVWFSWLEEEKEGEIVLPDAETKALMNKRLYEKVFKTEYNIKDFWTEDDKLNILKYINSQVFTLFYIKNESGKFSWDYARFYFDKGIDRSTFNPATASEELRKEHEREYSLANFVIKNYTELLLKPVHTYQTGFNEFVKYFYDTKKTELGTNIFKYPWIDGKTYEILDPRTYYKNGSYDFTKLENDVKEYALLKEPKYVNPVSGEENAAKLMRLNVILSMFGEYMYLKGSSEIPNITQNSIQSVKTTFYNYWENKEIEQWGFYWKWNTLNQERLEQERQRYLALLQGQQALQDYIELLEAGKFQAVLEIAGGGLSVGGTVAVFIFFPPSNLGGWTLGSASIGFGIDQVSGGIGKLGAIKNGMFDPNKEYKPAKGIIMGIAGEYGEQVGFAYDITSILVAFASGTGEAMKSVSLLQSIKGNEIEAIIRGYAAGAEYVNVGVNIYYLKQ